MVMSCCLMETDSGTRARRSPVKRRDGYPISQAICPMLPGTAQSRQRPGLTAPTPSLTAPARRPAGPSGESFEPAYGPQRLPHTAWPAERRSPVLQAPRPDPIDGDAHHRKAPRRHILLRNAHREFIAGPALRCGASLHPAARLGRREERRTPASGIEPMATCLSPTATS